MTILALFSLIAMPRLLAQLMTNRLDEGVSAFRTDLGFARARSISTGLRHEVYVDPESGELWVQAFHPEQTQQGAGSVVATDQSTDVVLRDQLHQDIRVVKWRVYALGYEQSGQAAQPVEGAPLTFYPEGTGDSAELVLQDPDGRQRALRVNGFLGQVQDVDPETLQ